MKIGKNTQLDEYINEYKKLRIVAGIGLFTHQDKII